MEITRRDFVGQATATGLVAAAAGSDLVMAAPPAAMPARLLGRTGLRVPVLGFGTAPLGSDNSPPDEVERTVNGILDLGIIYVDAAPVYGDPKSKYGNVEMKLKGVVRSRRREMFLVTKVNTGSGQKKQGILEQLQKSLSDLGTDHVDLVHIHNLGDWDMDRLMGEDGVLAALREAKMRGWTRFIGTSGHMRPARFVRLIETGDIDVTMNVFNFADRSNYDFEGLVLPAAKKRNVGVVAMKVLGGAIKWQYDGNTKGVLAEHHEQAIRFSLGVPGVACAVVGFATVDEARKALDVAARFKPLTTAERDELLAAGRKLAVARAGYYGPVDG